jgi:hypothetical protein
MDQSDRFTIYEYVVRRHNPDRSTPIVILAIKWEAFADEGTWTIC